MSVPTAAPTPIPTPAPSPRPSAVPSLNVFSSPVLINNPPSAPSTARPTSAGQTGYAIFSTFSSSTCDPASLLVQEIDAFGPCYQVLDAQSGQATSSYTQLYYPASGLQGTIKISLYSDTTCRNVRAVRSQPSSLPGITQSACMKNDGSGASLPDPNALSSSNTYSTFSFSPGLGTPPTLVPQGLQFTSFSTPCFSAPGVAPGTYQTTVAAAWAYPPRACFVDTASGRSGQWTCNPGEPYFYLSVFNSLTCCTGASSQSSCRSISQPYGMDACNVMQQGQIDSRYLYMVEACNTVSSSPALARSVKPSFGPEEVTGLGIAFALFLIFAFVYARARARRLAVDNLGPRADEFTGNIPAAAASVNITPTATVDLSCPDGQIHTETLVGTVVRLAGKGPPVAHAVPTAYSAVAAETRVTRGPLSLGRSTRLMTIELPVLGAVSAEEFESGSGAAARRGSMHQV